MWVCEDVSARERESEDVSMWRCEDEQMWRWEDVKMSRCEDEKMWRWKGVKMSRCEDEQMWRWKGVKMSRCEDEKVMWVCEDVKMSRYEDEQMWRWADVKMSRCEDEKVWEKVWRWEDEIQTPTIGRTLRSDALGKNNFPRFSNPKFGGFYILNISIYIPPDWKLECHFGGGKWI